jgi:hypothetical protein
MIDSVWWVLARGPSCINVAGNATQNAIKIVSLPTHILKIRSVQSLPLHTSIIYLGHMRVVFPMT